MTGIREQRVYHTAGWGFVLCAEALQLYEKDLVFRHWLEGNTCDIYFDGIFLLYIYKLV